MHNLFHFVLFGSLLALAVSAPAIAAATVDTLRCEYRVDPLGIDAAAPRLSWVIVSDRRGERQSAYRILVASSPDLLARDQGDLWDTGKIISDQSNQVEYGGKPLVSQKHCHWKVRVWDREGKASAWSAPALWSMGLLRPTDWQARWIGFDAAYEPSPGAARDDSLFNIKGLKWVGFPLNQAKIGLPAFFRKQFDLPADRKIRRAILALYAFNSCTASVNGKPVGQAFHWDRTARLDTTKDLQPGANVVAIAAHHTDPYPPQIIGRLVVEFETGEDLVVPIDHTWTTSQQTANGWDSSGFDDHAWTAGQEDDSPWHGPPPVADLARLPAPYLRKEFSVDRAVRRATIYVTALGVYELRLNGRRVGKDVLAPGWTEFRKRVHYQAYDVTSQVARGRNALGAILGDGWYASTLAHLARRNIYGGRPRFLAHMTLEFADGTTQVVATDGSWKAAFGPIRHADLLMGCEYDARLAMPGWDAAGFDDHAWQPVVEQASPMSGALLDVTARLQAAIQEGQRSITISNEALGGDPAPGVVKAIRITSRMDDKEMEQTVGENSVLDLGTAEKPVTVVRAAYGKLDGVDELKVQASVAEPSRPLEELPALKMTEPRPGCYTYDLGQNMVGWVRLKVHGEAGQRITVRHGEMLNTDGTIYTANLRSAPAADFYILSGMGEEVLEPYFTSHGFRYVEVSGLAAPPGLDAVTGIVVHTAMRRTGSFECSYPLLNKLYNCIIWGQKGNYLEVPTDCPQRDERMGWTGDTQFFAPTGAYNYDVANFFDRWLTTCRDDQNADGTFPHVVPDIMGGGGATAWGDAALLCTYDIYHVYGDTRLVAEQFAAMDHYMQWLDTKTTDGISHVGGFGDWLNAGGGASGPAIDTAYHAYLAEIMADMARAIGRTADADRYAKLHEDVKAAFVKAFVQPDGSLKDCSQTGYALAFSMGLVPAELRKKVAGKFVSEIERFKWHLATGFIGTPRLLPALHTAGRDDIAYRLLLTDTYPSWLFPVKNGATTMWERWNGWTPDGGFGDIGMNSYNHYAFGAVGQYLYGEVGGIQAASPGYKTILIQPVIGNGLTWARTHFESMYGMISTSWKTENKKLTLDIAIPANTTATVFVPASDPASVTESGQPASRSVGVKFLRVENGAAVYEVGSGTYQFQSVD